MFKISLTLFMDFISNIKKCRIKRNMSVKSRIPKTKNKTHNQLLDNFFEEKPEALQMRKYIPKKYLQLKKTSLADNLYLIDPTVAKQVASIILPFLKENENQLISETNAGLGIITAALLDEGIKLIRLYESCPEFRFNLKEFDEIYPNKVEIFTKDMFNLHRYAYLDTQDGGNRIEQMLSNVPRKSWADDPVMTVIGPMPKSSFIKYLITSLILQKHVVSCGRIQLFALMRPRDYIILTGGPNNNLHTYKYWSVLFTLLFDHVVLEDFPRKAFLPWETKYTQIHSRTQYPSSVDQDKLYLVQINFKRELPTSADNLLALFYFTKQIFSSGKNKIIPTIEKWVPGCGEHIIVPRLDHQNLYFNEMNIFTQISELTPQQVLLVFKEMMNFPSYEESPFKGMIESYLLQNETIETGLNDSIRHSLGKNITEDIKVESS